VSAGRRRFIRWLGLGPLAQVACKIEAILDLPPVPEVERPSFPEPPPRIPEQLADAEEFLHAGLEAFFAREGPYLQGELRQRSPEQPHTPEHLIALLQGFGLEAAGPRGGWLQPVALRLVEHPADAAVVVRVRPEHPGNTDAAVVPIDLSEYGAFRQRRAGRIDGLLLAGVRQVGEPLPRELVAGRVVLLRAAKELDMTSDAALEQLDGLAALARQSGAAGCVVLTACADDALVRLRERWSRQFHLGETSEADELVLEGVLAASGSERLVAALASAPSWVLDADLGLRERTVVSHNVIGRIAGRELPGEAAVVVCAWDTPGGGEGRPETLRLLASLATLAQLVEWQRRGAQPRRSIVVVFAVDAGLGAGQLEHARWSTGAGVQPTSLVAFDRLVADVVAPQLLLSGHFDAKVGEMAERCVREDGRGLQFGKELTLPSLSPYLRTAIPVMTIGAAVDAAPAASATAWAGLHAEVRLLRNLLLALAEQVGPRVE